MNRKYVKKRTKRKNFFQLFFFGFVLAYKLLPQIPHISYSRPIDLLTTPPTPIIIIIVLALINFSCFSCSQILSGQFCAISNATLWRHLFAKSLLCHHEDRLSRISSMSGLSDECTCIQHSTRRWCHFNADFIASDCIHSSLHSSASSADASQSDCHSC